MPKQQKFRPGDKVEWDSPQGTVEGTVREKITEEVNIKGHKVVATDNDPQYRVKSDRTGAEAAHKPEELRKRDEGDDQ